VKIDDGNPKFNAEFTLPIDPTPKLRSRSTKLGFHYTPIKTKKFEYDLKILIQAQWKSAPLEIPLELAIIFQIKRPKSISYKKRPYPSVKPDLDNLEKSCLDACNNLLWRDDALIIKVTKEKLYGNQGQIYLKVMPYQP